MEQNIIEEEKNIYRPKKLENYCGQEKLKEMLSIIISAVTNRNDTLEHILFYGPPGLGKTTIANIIANELEKKIVTISAPMVEKPGDLAIILTSLEEGDILFIDEIHRLKTNIEEILYSAMEDYFIDVIINNGKEQQSVKIDLNKFTLIGATTRKGLITKPLLDRFSIDFRMEYYSEKELSEIIFNASNKVNKTIDEISLSIISKASRGTPRIALNIFKRVRDYCDRVFPSIDNINETIINKTFEIFEINKYGLDKMDIMYLKKLKLEEKTIGLNTLSSYLNEDIKTIEEVIEPFLIQNNLIEITKSGRKGTVKLKDLDI